MSEKIEQCKRDIKTLQQELVRLEAEEKKKLPIIEFVQFNKPRDRIVIRLSDEAIKYIKGGKKAIVLNSIGEIRDWSCCYDTQFHTYRNYEPVFGEIHEDETAGSEID